MAPGPAGGSALENAGIGAWDLDLVTLIGRRSIQHDRIFGYDALLPEWTYEMFLDHVLPEDRPEVHRKFRHAIDTGSEWSFECRILRHDGEIRWIWAAGSALPDAQGRQSRMVGIVQDITDRKVTEEALRGSQARLEEAARNKNDFLAVLSHELRNPLTPIINSLHILERAAPGGDQAGRAREVIERQVDQLARLVDDLLDVTRIDSGKIQVHRRRLELNDLVGPTAEDHRSLIERAGLTLKLRLAPQPIHIRGDSNRMAQVVGNLLQNAAKFTPRGGEVTVSLAADADRHEAVLRVADTGAGMESSMLERLFEPFMQADSTLDRSKGGLGLGLALVKGLVEQHGGSVEATSAGPGQGSTFTVRLPLDLAEPVTTGGERPAGRPERRRVLIIEDNVDAAESLHEILELLGHRAAVAHNGPHGLALARTFHPDLVLCDIGLPGMDGYAVARALREDPALAGSQLVALSGYALPEDLQRAADAGFDRHVSKPVSLDGLREVLAHPG